MLSHVLWINYCLFLGPLCRTHTFKNIALRVVNVCANLNEVRDARELENHSEYMWVDEVTNRCVKIDDMDGYITF